MSWKPGSRKLSNVFSGRFFEILSEGMLGLAGRWPENPPIAVMWLSATPSLSSTTDPKASFAPVIQCWVSI